jgi:hypothetical protein
MKKLTLLFIGIFFLTSAFTQNNFPTPADNPFWMEQHEQLWACSTNGPYGYCSDYYCECTRPAYYKTDTVINDVVYNRLYTRGVCHGIQTYWNPYCPTGFNYLEPEFLLATIRQDTTNKQVYINHGNWDELLYDFNLTVGQDYPQTANNYMGDSLVVSSEDLIMIGEKYVKQWGLGIKENGVITNEGFGSIIEGVGSTFGLLSELMLPFENWDELLCFGMNDVVLYPDASYECDITVNITEVAESETLKVYPNPASSVLTIETSGDYLEDGQIRILNTCGQEVLKQAVNRSVFQINTSSLERGIYFIQFFNEEVNETVIFIKE